ncbi:MAG: SAM-dependent methyltransferase [Clostridia bacterium]|nr:SAM-dependent methyltransferase [Clostridia bacterium]
MNKQNVQKLALFLTGIEQRLLENADFFKKITAVYKSGTKEYSANIVFENNRIKMNYNGNTEVMEVTWLSARISKHAEKYDGVVVVYEERGTTIYIEADNKNVKMKTKETGTDSLLKADASLKTDGKEGMHHGKSHIGNRDYYIKVGQADALLKEIGVLSAEGKVKNDMIRKYNQIDHFIELISDMLKDLCDRYESVTVLDCACGKSYLTFVLNYYIKEVLKKPCHFIGLDYSNNVIEASKKMAENLGYRNMDFKVTDIKNYVAAREIHMVISLHACDTATDEAIALAVNNRVKSMVVVPCCHKELLKQYRYKPFEHIIKHGILKARLADVLTDGTRALLLEGLGYKVSVVEYISPLETPKNLMIRAEKTNAPNRKILDEYYELKKLLNISPALEKLIYIQES